MVSPYVDKTKQCYCFSGSPLEIGQSGVDYTGGRDPLLGVGPYGSVHIKDAVVWLDNTKLRSKVVTYEFLILKVDAIDGSTDDLVMGNNVRAQRVSVLKKSLTRK